MKNMWKLYLFVAFLIAFLFVLVFAIVEDNVNEKKEFEKDFADGAQSVLESPKETNEK
jgi:hypothetical protein